MPKGGGLRDLSRAAGGQELINSSPHSLAQVFGVRVRFRSQGVEEKSAIDRDMPLQALPKYIGAAWPATRSVVILFAVMPLGFKASTIDVRRQVGGY